jgi:membrane-anchored mycosin MYCP
MTFMSSRSFDRRRYAGVAIAMLLVLAPGSAIGTRVPAGTARPESLAGAPCDQPGTTIRPVPWPQQLFAPERIWPLTEGAGTVVAVVDTGVDGNHPQLRGGTVLAGIDLLAPDNRPADVACDTHGTNVAGVIAGQRSDETGFVGLTPAAKILPVKIADRTIINAAVDAKAIATGIAWAASQRADVINISIPVFADDPDLRTAVAGAIASGIVIVAAVGDNGDRNGNDAPTPYPAAYPGVIGVGAVDVHGVGAATSQRGTYVDLMAPGVGILTTQLGSGHAVVGGTGYAAAFVSAAAALVLARWPGLDPAEVEHRLIATANPPPGGSTAYGHGVVNPYQAVTDQLEPRPVGAAPTFAPYQGAHTGADSAGARALRVALVLGAAAILVLVGSVVLRRGERRKWTAQLAPAPREPHEDETPGPPVMLFNDR